MSRKCSPGCACKKHPKGPLSYSGAHNRVRSRRGNAADYSCTECGGAARDWALIHEKDGQDPDDYQPMCHRCHFVYDGVAERKRGTVNPHKGEPLPANQGHSWNGKLTEADIPVIRQLLIDGTGLRVVARRYGVGHATIAKIRDRQYWSWVRLPVRECGPVPGMLLGCHAGGVNGINTGFLDTAVYPLAAQQEMPVNTVIQGRDLVRVSPEPWRVRPRSGFCVFWHWLLWGLADSKFWLLSRCGCQIYFGCGVWLRSLGCLISPGCCFT